MTNLPTAEFSDTDNDGTYETEYKGFTKKGTYQITVYAKDAEDYYSLPVQTAVIRTEDVANPRGDINGNGEADLPDAVTALQVLAGIPGVIWYDYASAGSAGGSAGVDVNGDGKVGFEEVFYIFDILGK
ncbi:hypothetical protein QUF80_19640 [Desulfococcaceae bacterium HSG8]|nr:hypothetical protein [Desulfococcaceae bacterium HSG8]